jgi:hypothetical protein
MSSRSSGRHGNACHQGRQIATVTHVTKVVRSPRSPRCLPAVAPRALCYYLITQSVPQKKTLHFTITNISFLTLFKEIIAVNTENHTEQKMQTYRLSSRWNRYLPLGFKGLMQTQCSRCQCFRHKDVPTNKMLTCSEIGWIAWNMLTEFTDGCTSSYVTSFVNGFEGISIN